METFDLYLRSVFTLLHEMFQLICLTLHHSSCDRTNPHVHTTVFMMIYSISICMHSFLRRSCHFSCLKKKSNHWYMTVQHTCYILHIWKCFVFGTVSFHRRCLLYLNTVDVDPTSLYCAMFTLPKCSGLCALKVLSYHMVHRLWQHPKSKT